MTAYENYLSGQMSDYIPTDEELQKGFDSLPKIPQRTRGSENGRGFPAAGRGIPDAPPDSLQGGTGRRGRRPRRAYQLPCP